MVNKGEDTEQLILNAAQSVFTRKGMNGARMQEIADEAGINKALLHYYFRNKEQLFGSIFSRTFSRFIPALYTIFNDDSELESKIRKVVAHYIDEFADNTYIPLFLINEIHQNPERLNFMANALGGLRNTVFMRQLEDGIRKGRYRAVSPAHLVTNILALTVFPLIASPMIGRVFDMKKDEYRHFLEEKKEVVPDMIIRTLKP